MIFERSALIEATGATAAVGSADASPVVSFSIDSRRMERDACFVALRAERDGHDFVVAAHAAGAGVAIVDHVVEGVAGVGDGSAVLQIVVPDTIDALAAIGRAARARLAVPVVGVTGSVGKTSTKDLLAAIYRSLGPATASERSLNNELGLPLTLANADPASLRVVVEMGARGAGHIRHLCEIADPTVGVVTSVAAAHTEAFGDLAAIAAAKGELVEWLPATGTAVLNADDPAVAAMAARTAAAVLTFGTGGDVAAHDVRLDDALRPSFTMRSPWGTRELHLEVRGRHNVDNALAACAAALATGVSLDDLDAIESAHLSPSRLDVRVSRRGGTVIDDAYNANPTSMRAALRALSDLPADRRVAVLGVMAELGEGAEDEHAAIAAEARAAGIEVVAVGTDWYGSAPLDGIDDAIERLAVPLPGEAVLVKASRVAGLDRLAAYWCNRAE